MHRWSLGRTTLSGSRPSVSTSLSWSSYTESQAISESVVGDCWHVSCDLSLLCNLVEATLFWVHRLFQHWFSMTFPWPKKWKFMTSAQHIFPSKRYRTYECIPELVVTVPSARSTIVKKIRRFIIWLYKWSRVTFTELFSAVVKIPWQYHHFPWLSMTFAIFHDFPGLENGLPKFHDFPWPGAPWLS